MFCCWSKATRRRRSQAAGDLQSLHARALARVHVHVRVRVRVRVHVHVHVRVYIGKMLEH